MSVIYNCTILEQIGPENSFYKVLDRYPKRTNIDCRKALFISEKALGPIINLTAELSYSRV